MKKRTLTLTLTLTLIVSAILSACNSQETKPRSELDKIIEDLPTAQIVEGKIDRNLTSDEDASFLSVTGKIVSISIKDITIESNKKEYIFTINDDTTTFGGKVGISDTVTITYEGTEYKRDIAAKIITVLSEDTEETTPIINETNSENSTPANITQDENITEEVSENTISTEEFSEEISLEHSFEEEQTSADTTEQTTTKQDNSEIISTLQNNISLCEQQIDVYKWGIDEYNKSISEFENLKSKYEKELEDAKIELKNAEKKWVYVFENDGFKQVPNESAIADAQEYVDFYENLISRCDTNIEEALLQISQCELEIDALESEIIIYQAEIAELS